MTPSNRRIGPPKGKNDRPPADLASGACGPSRSYSLVLPVLRRVLTAALIATVSIGTAWVARRYILTSPRFAVVAIDIQGQVHRSTAAILVESGLVRGTNIFATDLDAAREAVLQDPWIADVTLTRHLPGTIRVTVLERKPAALVALGDVFLATADGVPFKKLESGDDVDLPVVTGVTAELLGADPEGTKRLLGRAIDLATDFQRGELGPKAVLQEVHVAPDGTMTLIVGHNALQLVLGTGPFRRKLQQAARVVAELDRRGAKADAILLDNDARPERVVVRMR